MLNAEFRKTFVFIKIVMEQKQELLSSIILIVKTCVSKYGGKSELATTADKE